MNIIPFSKWKNVKLPPSFREAFLAAIRIHISALELMISPNEVVKVKDDQLLELVKTLGIYTEGKRNDTDIVDDFVERGFGYPFSGTLEFPITMSLLGHQVSRTARINYERSPDWPYYDPDAGKELLGGDMTNLNLEILAEHSSICSDCVVERARTSLERESSKACNACTNFSDHGIWSKKMWDEIKALIDKECRAKDAANRCNAGV